MSTRGAIGFIKNGIEKIAYNGHDSYVSGLGKNLLSYLEGKSIEELNEIFDEIKVTDREGGSDNFDPETGFAKEFEDYSSFLYNSLFCEYAYIINLDTKKLEFYKGYNKNTNARGRYANKYAFEDDKRYCGVALVNQIPLSKIFKGKIKVDETRKTFIEV